MTLARTGKIEIPAPLAVYYMMKGSTMISSHEFNNLPFYAFIKELESDSSSESRLQRLDQSNYAPISVTSDYLHRPEELESICLYDFCMRYKVCNGRVKEKKTETVSFEEYKQIKNRDQYPFSKSHPLFVKKYVMDRKSKVVPDIVGPRLPDSSEISDVDKKESFSKFALILFKPYRNKLELQKIMIHLTNRLKPFTLLKNSLMPLEQEYYKTCRSTTRVKGGPKIYET